MYQVIFILLIFFPNNSILGNLIMKMNKNEVSSS